MELVTPGQEIPCTDAFLRGHGTFVQDGKLLASVAGVVQRVNKLVSVIPMRSRYTGNVGDVVIARVMEVGNKRWTVDVGAGKAGILMLSSINLPSGEQRRRTLEDSLNMREIYKEADLVSAEVHQILHDGALSLHTRSDKYGLLARGLLVEVPHVLIRRTKQRFHALPADVGVSMLVAANGLVWLSPADDAPADAVPAPDAMRRVARVRNSILLLAQAFIQVDPGSVMDVYAASVELGVEPPAMLYDAAVAEKLTGAVRAKQEAKAAAGRDEDD